MAWDDRLWPGDRGVLGLIARSNSAGGRPGSMTVSSLLAVGRIDATRLCDLALAGWCELVDHASERDALGLPARVIRVTEAGLAALAAIPARAGVEAD